MDTPAKDTPGEGTFPKSTLAKDTSTTDPPTRDDSSEEPSLEGLSSKDSLEGSLVATCVCSAQSMRAARRPLFLPKVPAGFPSPAEDYVETPLDLNEHLIGGKEEAVFFVRVSGESMTEAGIFDGDLLTVDRSIEPEPGDVVVAALDGELTVKRFESYKGRPYLVPAAEGHEPIPIQPGQDLVVWGVVQHAIHEVS